VSIERAELHDAAQKAFPADQLRPARDESWKLIADMGWLMIRLPEEDGGLGLGREASSAIHYEMGRVVSTVPLLAAQLGLQAVVQGRFDGRDDWIARISGGDYVPLHMLPAKLAQSGETVSGTISGVFEADMASAIVAYLPQGYAIVPLDAPGVAVSERPIWDPSRRLFDVTLADFSPTLVLSRDGQAMHDALAPETHLALAADCLGGASAALDMTIEYLKTRRQFGRPLAMFQALKHRCADLKVQVVAAEALLWERAADEHATLSAFGGIKALASDVYRMVTEEAIQLHGGIGLTEEHPIHLFMKRAMLNLQLGGSLDHWRERAGREALAAFA
jgi:alkylation response protein AidB-like acyl-CoA dehydrogenase